jgi:hypothetical protein
MVEIAHSGGHDVKALSFGIVPGAGGFEGIKMEQRGGVHKAPVKKETIICGSWGLLHDREANGCKSGGALCLCHCLRPVKYEAEGWLIDLAIIKRGCLTWRGWGRSKEEMFVYGCRKVGWFSYPLLAHFFHLDAPLSLSFPLICVRCAWSIAKIRFYTRSLLAVLHIVGLPPHFHNEQTATGPWSATRGCDMVSRGPG